MLFGYTCAGPENMLTINLLGRGEPFSLRCQAKQNLNHNIIGTVNLADDVLNVGLWVGFTWVEFADPRFKCQGCAAKLTLTDFLKGN